MAYRIRRSKGAGGVVFALSGEMNEEHSIGLRALLAAETGTPVLLDMEDVTVVDREAVQFLARVEAKGVRIVNCPGYVRTWIDAETAG